MSDNVTEPIQENAPMYMPVKPYILEFPNGDYLEGVDYTDLVQEWFNYRREPGYSESETETKWMMRRSLADQIIFLAEMNLIDLQNNGVTIHTVCHTSKPSSMDTLKSNLTRVSDSEDTIIAWASEIGVEITPPDRDEKIIIPLVFSLGKIGDENYDYSSAIVENAKNRYFSLEETNAHLKRVGADPITQEQYESL